jgi:hypothetical protein
MIFIIGMNLGSFPHTPTAITGCIQFQGDLSLAAGGDLSRIRDSRAPSAGLNF